MRRQPGTGAGESPALQGRVKEDNLSQKDEEHPGGAQGRCPRSQPNRVSVGGPQPAWPPEGSRDIRANR